STDSLIAHGASVGEFGGRYTVRTIKVAIDGALGSRGALLLQPYSDDPANHGLLTTDTAAYRDMLARSLAKGIQVETHAIGDGGNRLVLDLYEQAFAAVPAAGRAVAEPRFRIEHAQIVDPADIPRFKELGVIPSMQPSHAIGDLYFAPSRLGSSRLKGAYAWKTFIDLGLPVPGGSDAPVERGEPMIEYYAAVARRDIRGNAGPDSLWHPEQKVSREEALKMFTTYAAFAAFEEGKRGSITPGKWADLTILDQDILTIPEADILKTRTVMTVIGGEVVHSLLP
ncbi:MAG: amidohydrolase, partial [Gemmatimonadales bacterium]